MIKLEVFHKIGFLLFILTQKSHPNGQAKGRRSCIGEKEVIENDPFFYFQDANGGAVNVSGAVSFVFETHNIHFFLFVGGLFDVKRSIVTVGFSLN